MTDDRALRRAIADACRVLEHEGQEHFHLGHVSAREPGAQRVWVKPSALGLGEVSADDLVQLNLDGNRLHGARPIHHEMPIHLEIYRRRPDVACVVHTHPFYAAAFSASHATFEMVSQDSVLFATQGIGYYPSARLVVTREQGAALAEALGPRRVVVLKNHGIAVAGPSVADAVFHAVSFDRSLRLQLAAAQLGEVNPISPEEVAEMAAYFDQSYQGRIATAYDYLLRRAGVPPTERLGA